MKKNSIFFYEKHLKVNKRIIQVGQIQEGFFEIFDLIHEFQSTHDFVSWITNQKFEYMVYKNEIKCERYSRVWEYTFEKISFLSGALEVDKNQIPEDLKGQSLSLNCIFCESEPSISIEKMSIYSILTEFHCTIISHAIYKDLVIGSIWEIYDFSTLLKLYEKKQDPMRYWKITRRE